MSKILVILHIYYPEIWNELKDCLKNITEPYDLYVTTIDANKYLKQDILNFNPKAHFEIVENRGFDVGPFIYILNNVNLDNYEYIVKLHTKRSLELGEICFRKLDGRKWREKLLSFIKTSENFAESLRYFSENKKVGMLSSVNTIVENDFYDESASKSTKQWLKEHNLKLRRFSFVAGTMFIARASIFKNIQELKVSIKDFPNTNGEHKSQLAHVFERLFGYYTAKEGYFIRDPNFSISEQRKIQRRYLQEYLQKIIWKQIKRFIFQSKISKKGKLIIKIFRIPIFYKEISPAMEIKRHQKVFCPKRLSTLSYLYQKGKLTFLQITKKLSKNELKEQKKELRQKRSLSKSKLGVAYNVFDGEELLEASIKSIREVASYVVVVYQTISNFKEQASSELVPLLNKLKVQGLIDDLYLYEPKFNELDNHYNEKRKRDIGLALAKRAGCDYFLSMDTDEFYHAEQIKSAMDFIYDEKIESSAVSIIEYLKDPTNQLVNGYTFAPAEDKQNYNFYVPFIMKIHRFKKQRHSGAHFPCLVDPTRGLNNRERFYLFPKHMVAMHHMCTVRKDLASKYANSNLRKGYNDKTLAELQKKILNFDFDKNLVKVSEFDGIYVQKVPNVFGIDIDNKEFENG